NDQRLKLQRRTERDRSSVNGRRRGLEEHVDRALNPGGVGGPAASGAAEAWSLGGGGIRLSCCPQELHRAFLPSSPSPCASSGLPQLLGPRSAPNTSDWCTKAQLILISSSH
ncbi:unnamed protein product, partial [Pleuronectes platessa]